jgi:hypothetical protein
MLWSVTSEPSYRADYLDFRREMVPGLISVVWPSRHRIRMAAEALDSVRDSAVRLDGIEFGVAYDGDDPRTGDLAAKRGCFTYRSAQRLGWTGLATYFARLSEQSRGEWLVWWGDDGRMLTPGWDEIVRKQKPGILYLKGEAFDNVYPVVHRSVLEAIGEVLPSPLVDTWLTEVGKWADCLWPVPILTLEDRFDLTGNNRDQVWEEGSIHAYDFDAYCAAPMWHRRLKHASQVRKALGIPGDWAGPTYAPQ